MKIIAMVLFAFALSPRAFAGPEITYVGLGRYACSGKGAECVQVDMSNRAVSEMQRRQYQEEQSRAQEYVDRSRREERGQSEIQNRPLFGASRWFNN